jgi:Flp pilus assembly protein TadB
MPKFKAYVKVPADSTGKLKRIVTKNIDANSSTEALALLRGQYGTKNINIASQISEAKPRKTIHNKINSTIKKTTPSYSRIKKNYKRKKSSDFVRTSNSSSDLVDAIGNTAIGQAIFIFIGIIIIGWIVSAIFDSPTILYVFIVIAFVFIIKKIIDLIKYIYSFFKNLFS